MTHDPYCWFSDIKHYSQWDGDGPCNECRRISQARADERKQAIERVKAIDDFSGASLALVIETILNLGEQ